MQHGTGQQLLESFVITIIHSFTLGAVSRGCVSVQPAMASESPSVLHGSPEAWGLQLSLD